jgi:YidC/Oxa1 family membrane protein insertase
MPNIFYTLIIFPIEQVIELCYAFALRFTKSPGLSIIVLSMVVSTLILPIYLMAEQKQKEERNKQKQMKEKINKIKTVFKGDEKYMLISTLYRQNNYHPIYALRNSLDLFIQIPFFIAAYHFLHNLELLNGQKFKFLIDLGCPDGLLGGINLLPILMTIINLVSGAIYAKELLLKDKIQLYGVALVFLVLLYNSPSALVLYWTCNNIYNLIKNIVLKNDKLKKLIYPAIILLIYCFIVFILLSPHDIGKYKRFILVFSTGFIILLQYRKQITEYIRKNIIIKNITLTNTNKIFVLSILGIFLLVGLVIPSSLIVSSVEEFSFIEPYSSPLPFIGITLLESAGILLWLICIYFLFSKQARQVMTFLFAAVLGIFMINVFFFNTYYGFMTPDLNFSYFHSVSTTTKIINILVLLFTAAVIILLLLIKKEKILLALQSIIIISLLCYGITNLYKINNNFTKINMAGGNTSIQGNLEDFKKNYILSKNGKNLIIIMLDMAVSGYVPYIFDEKPELLDSFKGFTYYPNTISFGPTTLHGLSGIFGGYYYTPLNRQNRKNEDYYDKLYESLQVLPRIMAESGFNVSIFNTHYIDNSIYNNYKNITAGRNLNIYTPYYLKNINPVRMKNFYQALYVNFIRFSFLKAFPIMFHTLIYDNGNYLSLFKNNYNYYLTTIDSFSSLYFLPNITEITSDYSNYAVIFSNDLAHEPGFMQAPEYIPSNKITNKGNGLYANEVYYHGNMASFLLFAKWFDFLKENGVYDNTRIIIVSDHGTISIKPFPNSIIFSDIDFWRLEKSRALLLVKDFNADYKLLTDNTFMTNADVPHIATNGLIQTLINPFNGRKMLIEKDNGVTITTNKLVDSEKLIQEGIKSNELLHVKDNIFELSNWTKVNIKD